MGLKQLINSVQPFKLNNKLIMKENLKKNEKFGESIINLSACREIKIDILEKKKIIIPLIKKFINKLQNLTQYRNTKKITSNQIDLINDLSVDKKAFDDINNYINQNPNQIVKIIRHNKIYNFFYI